MALTSEAHDIEELARLTSEFEKSLAQNKLATYAPYRWQQRFHDAGPDNTERMLMAANRCITPWTVVETVPQSRRILDILYEKVFYVRSWADGCECIAQASGVFLKGIEPAFRVLMGNGKWFDCSRKHRVLTSEGWLSLDQLVQTSDGLRWTQTIEDFEASCAVGDYQDDQPLPLAASSGLELPPSRGGAHRRDPNHFSQRGVEGHKFQYNRAYQQCDLISTEDDPDRILGLCERFADPTPYIDALRRSGKHQDLLRCGAGSSQARSNDEDGFRQSFAVSSLDAGIECDACDNKPEPWEVLYQNHSPSVSQYGPGKSLPQWHRDVERIEIFYPFNHSPLVGGGHIEAIVPIGLQPILDFTVETTSCYKSGGVIHHNTGKTMSAGAEVALHLTGDYDELSREIIYPEFFENGERHPNAGERVWPNGWQGVRFDKPVLVWTGSPTNETSKDIVQKELLGGLGEALGTGWIPKGKIEGKPSTRQAGVKGVVDSFKVRHRSGGLSTAVLKTYEQGWQKWQGTAPDVVHLDEEPDNYMIYSEAQTRILSSGGILLVTFTPLLGVTELVDHFQKGGKGIYIQGATWEDAPHLEKEARDQLAQSYRAHERDARTKGIPMLGEGAVFPVSDEDIRFDMWTMWPAGVPNYFARIKGCDFGMDHPAAGVEIAWDRDQDVIYVIDAYRKAGEKAPYHAAWLSKGNRMIPVSWPHDGMNREKSGGKKLADAYRRSGANMLSKSARYPRSPGEAREKGGPQPVEPIVDEVLERMLTGRLKVAAHLSELFEEKRSYHRKDGRIVDRRDDILKALFYAIMMKRYAVSPGQLRTRKSNAPTRSHASARI